MSSQRQAAKGSTKRRLKSPQAQPPPKPFLSAEFVRDTSDEDAEESSSKSEQSPPASKKLAAAQRVQIKPPLRIVKPELAAKAQQNSKKPKLKSPSRSSAGSSASESEGDERRRSGSQSESETESSSESIAEAPRQHKQTAQQPSTAASAPIPYKPPPEFELASISSSSSSSLVDLFSPSNLQGKQIWHITVPCAVPISSVKEVAAQSVQNGTSILSHEDAHYGLIPEAEGEAAKDLLLLPFPKTNDYRDAHIKIARTLHIRQLVRLPKLSHGLDGLPNSATKPPAKKAVRQQPEGLRMRYHPFGYSDSSSSESPPQVSRFRAPPIVVAPQATKNRKDDKVNEKDHGHQKLFPASDAPVLETPKMPKKRKHAIINNEEQEDQTLAITSKKRKYDKANKSESPSRSHNKPMQSDTAADTRNLKASKATPSRTPVAKKGSTEKSEDDDDPDIPTTTEPKPSQETKEDRAKRKEKKHPPKGPEDMKKEKSSLEKKTDAPTSTSTEKPGKETPHRSNEEKRRRKEEKKKRLLR